MAGRETEYDYIIVGAGSAGCVVARRLSDIPGIRVLLIEAGPEADDFWIRTPAGIGHMMHHERYNWNYDTEPVPTLNNRSIYWPRGKVVGGSSAINGMIYNRGDRRDYDHWQSLGNPGWGWDTVGPLFESMEHDTTRNGPSKNGAPVHLSPAAIIHPTCLDFVSSGQALGLRRNEDFNSGDIEGVGLFKFNIRNGKRLSSYDAYLAPVRKRANLTIVTQAQVLRIVMTGRAATGVEVALKDGETVSFRAAKEVILSAGALNSPHLLMLSGIGDPDELRRQQIEVVHALPGVGANLQDHFATRVQFYVTPGSSYNRVLRGWRKYVAGAHYLLTNKGYLALASSLAGAFFKSSPGMAYPDVEISFRPMTFTYAAGGIAVHGHDAISGSVYRVRPTSRGKVGLKSSDPRTAPKFEPNYLSTPDDAAAMISGVRMMRAIAAQEPLRSRVISEMSPGENVMDDDSLIAYMRAEGQCTFHLAGSCKMGPDAMAVVDHRLRVHGIERLRVADASIMPVVVSNNTNAASMVIGENAARMILEDAR